VQAAKTGSFTMVARRTIAPLSLVMAGLCEHGLGPRQTGYRYVSKRSATNSSDVRPSRSLEQPWLAARWMNSLACVDFGNLGTRTLIHPALKLEGSPTILGGQGSVARLGSPCRHQRQLSPKALFSASAAASLPTIEHWRARHPVPRFHGIWPAG
jgi:hypothetical protein